MDPVKQEEEDFKQSKARPPTMATGSEGPYVHPGGEVDVRDPVSGPPSEDSGKKFGRIGDATMPDEENRDPETQRGATTSPPS
jgi:hypothetical protein